MDPELEDLLDGWDVLRRCIDALETASVRTTSQAAEALILARCEFDRLVNKSFQSRLSRLAAPTKRLHAYLRDDTEGGVLRCDLIALVGEPPPLPPPPPPPVNPKARRPAKRREV